jgi:hypothetical protein
MDWMTVACGFDTTTFGIFSNSLLSSDSRHSIFIASSFHPHPSNERILNLGEFWAGFVFTFSLVLLFLHQLSNSWRVIYAPSSVARCSHKTHQ